MKGRLFAVALVVTTSISLGAQPQAPTSTGTAVIAGRVVAADTGAPIADAVLRLVSFDVMRVARSVVTDEQGRYEYPGLVAGRYQLEVTSIFGSVPGYLSLQYGQRTPTETGKPIDLIDGQRVANADFSLPRASAIEGTLVDEFGDPAPNIHIELSRVQYLSGSHRLIAVPGTGRIVSDDKGRYRVANLPPGDYYVSASGGAFADANAAGGFAVTYHSGTTEPSATKPLSVAVGRELTGVSFALVPARTGRVGGIVLDRAGQPVARGTVALATSDRGTLTRSAIARSGTNADGSFMFRNVPPGRYLLEAYGVPQGGGNIARAPYASAIVQMNGDDQTNLVMSVLPGVVARGTIAFEKTRTTRELQPDDVRMGVGIVAFDDSTSTGGGPNESVVNPDWTFSVSNVIGLRILRVDVRPLEWTVKRVTLSGRDVTDAGLDFRKGDVSGLEVVLTDAVSSVSGVVRDANRQPLSSYSVVMFSEDKTKWTFPSRFIQLARPNQDGSFKASRLPPGNYLAVALPTVQGNEWQDPEFLEKLRMSGVPVTVNEGDAKAIELTVSERPN